MKYSKRSILLSSTTASYREYLAALDTVKLPCAPAIIIDKNGIIYDLYDSAGWAPCLSAGGEDFNKGTIGVCLVEAFCVAQQIAEPQFEALVWTVRRLFKKHNINPAVFPKSAWPISNPTLAQSFRGVIPASAVTDNRVDPGRIFPYDRFVEALEVQ